MKLELRHPSAYLPYEVKFISSMDKPFDEYGLQPKWTLDGISMLFGDYCFLTKEGNDAYAIQTCKLILRPLSDLTKPCLEGGEIPRDYVTGYTRDIIDEIFSYLKDNHKKKLKKDIYYDMQMIPFRDILLLFEWHFDVFGLIESGLAIDINTLNK